MGVNNGKKHILHHYFVIYQSKNILLENSQINAFKTGNLNKFIHLIWKFIKHSELHVYFNIEATPNA